MTRVTPATFVATIAIATSAQAATDVFRLTTSDLAHREVKVKSFSATNVVVTDATKAADATLPIGSVVELRRATTSTVSNDGWFVLRKRDGERIVCKPSAIKDDGVICATRDLGSRTVPIADVASITLATLPDDATPSTKQDELRLANGDRLRGVISAGDARTVTCQTPDGQSVAVDWSNVRTIRFAETQQSAPATPAAFVVAIDGGTRVRATGVAVDGAIATLSLPGGEARVPFTSVVAIEHVGGDATMLAWATPASTTYEPFFPSDASTAAFVVDPAAAEANDATTAMRVRPKSTLRWATPPGVRRLHARCVLPPGKAFADVTVRVLDGDRVAFERANVKSGAPPIDVDVSVTGGGSVALEVDYGDDFDVQDQALWLDAAVLSSPPGER